MNKLILAMDSGTTKTICAISNEKGEILGVGVAGSSSYYAVSVEKAYENLRSAIKEAVLFANIHPEKVMFDVGCFGFTALDRKYDLLLNKRFVDSLKIIRKHLIVSDAVTALYAVTAGKPGVVIIAGTGSVAFGINKKGETAQSGGKEWLISDEGSAYHIATEGLRHALKDHDGRGEETLLKKMFIEHFKVSTFEDVIEEIYKDTSKCRIASLAPIVSEAAEKGDATATKILQDAGKELGMAAVAVARRLNMEKEPIIVGCVGRVFKSGFLILKTLQETVRKGIPKAIFKSPIFNPIQGAILLGMKEIGIPATENLLNKIEMELKKFPLP